MAAEAAAVARAARNESISPDKKRAVFIRDYNLWVRDLATTKETQLTSDGIEDFGYATDNGGWSTSDRPIVVWSPDSKKVATFQQDQRRWVKCTWSIHGGPSHVEGLEISTAGRSRGHHIERVIVDVDGAKVVRLQMPPDQHRSTLCDDVACRGGEWSDVEWSPDSSHLAFVSTSRDHKMKSCM